MFLKKLSADLKIDDIQALLKGLMVATLNIQMGRRLTLHMTKKGTSKKKILIIVVLSRDDY